jgi:putative transposase
MTRKNLIRSSEFPYHVTIRSNNKEWFDLPRDVVWSICLAGLTRANFKYPVKIEAFVLMSNHYHLLLYTPNADLDKFMNAFNTYLSKEIRIRTRRINRIFADRYNWKLINNNTYYMTVLRYIFQNPLRANLVAKCQDYPYSTLYLQLYQGQTGIKFPNDFIEDEYLSFFNQIISKEDQKKIKSELHQRGPAFL